MISAPGFPPSILLSDTKTEDGKILMTSWWNVVLYHFVFLDKGTNLDKCFQQERKECIINCHASEYGVFSGYKLLSVFCNGKSAYERAARVRACNSNRSP